MDSFGVLAQALGVAYAAGINVPATVAILGLALSGRPEAAQALRALQQPATTEPQRAFQAQVSDLVSKALEEHQRIATQGLANYYRTTQP